MWDDYAFMCLTKLQLGKIESLPSLFVLSGAHRVPMLIECVLVSIRNGQVLPS
jgi:hypothetical protein